MQKPPPFSNFLHPGYWPTWLGLALLSLAAWMPYRLQLQLGSILGYLTWLFGRERRYITEINIARCFPELDSQARAQLVKDTFRENGIGLIETASCWLKPVDWYLKHVNFIGLEQLNAARAEGRGVLLLGAHYSTLDLGGFFLNAVHPVAATYRPHNNPLFDAFMLRGRLSNCTAIFDRFDIRGAYKHLKQGHTLWYAPDQDYGPKHAVYAPFFGQQAATINAASRFANINHSAVFLIRQHRITGSTRYEIELSPFPPAFPTGSDLDDAVIINRTIEQAVRRHPAQYLWMHKRFKTQPGGKPESPYIHIKTPNHRLTTTQFQQMLEGATRLTEKDGVTDYLLADGLYLKKFPGQIGKRFYQRHQAKNLDYLSKAMRAKSIPCITVDNFFRIPASRQSAMTYFMPAGESLAVRNAAELPLEALAQFLAMLTHSGFTCLELEPQQLLIKDETFAIADPTGFREHTGPVTLAMANDSVTRFCGKLDLDHQDIKRFLSGYKTAALQLAHS